MEIVLFCFNFVGDSKDLKAPSHFDLNFFYLNYSNLVLNEYYRPQDKKKETRLGRPFDVQIFSRPSLSTCNIVSFVDNNIVS